MLKSTKKNYYVVDWCSCWQVERRSMAVVSSERREKGARFFLSCLCREESLLWATWSPRCFWSGIRS